jgi:hypothetical protein
MAKRARREAQLPGTALLADRGGLEGGHPLDCKRPGPHGLADAPDDGLGLSGQRGLVERKPIGRRHRAVRDNLVSWCQANDVSDHNPVDGNAAVDSVADDHGIRGDQRRQAVERPLGADLLE